MMKKTRAQEVTFSQTEYKNSKDILSLAWKVRGILRSIGSLNPLSHFWTTLTANAILKNSMAKLILMNQTPLCSASLSWWANNYYRPNTCSGTRPRTIKLKELGKSTLNHSLHTILSSHISLPSFTTFPSHLPSYTCSLVSGHFPSDISPRTFTPDE